MQGAEDQNNSPPKKNPEKGCFALLPTQTVGLGGDHPFPGPTELPGLAGSSQEPGPSLGADMIKCNPQCGEFKLLITTSSEAWLVLRGCLPCLSPLLLVLCVGQLGLEGLLGKQSLDFYFFFHADIPALPSVLLIPAGG